MHIPIRRTGNCILAVFLVSLIVLLALNQQRLQISIQELSIKPTVPVPPSPGKETKSLMTVESVFIELSAEENELIKNIDDSDSRNSRIADILRLFGKTHENLAAATSWKSSASHNTRSKTVRSKQNYDTLRKSLFPHVKEAVFDPASYSGAGIVICMGSRNRKSMFHGISTIQALRTVLNSNLPIEVFHLGKDDPINDLDRAKLNAIKGVTIRDLTDHTINRDTAGMSGWDMKPFAIIASSFRHAIMMDSDTVFLQNPTVLLSSPKYQQTGALFFNDRTLYHNSDKNVKWVRSLLENPTSADHLHYMQQKTQHELESGVVVVDKHVNLIGLAAASFILMDAHTKHEFKQVSHGDKESFWIGFSITGNPFAFAHDYTTGAIGKSTSRIENGVEVFTVCTVQIMHPDEYGQPLWINGGLSRNKFTGMVDKLKEIDVYLLEPGRWEGDGSLDGRGGFCLKTSASPVEFSKGMKRIIDESGQLYLDAYRNDGTVVRRK